MTPARHNHAALYARLCLAVLAVFVVASLAFLMAGCRSIPPSSPHYPPQIQRDCEWAYGQGRADYVARYGQPVTLPMWQVTMERGQKWGDQWAIMNGGTLCGGKTSGVYTTIGCGPAGEINRNDLRHEAFEAFCQVNGKAAH